MQMLINCALRLRLRSTLVRAAGVLNDAPLSIHHPVWVLLGDVLRLAGLQTHHHVRLGRPHRQHGGRLELLQLKVITIPCCS